MWQGRTIRNAGAVVGLGLAAAYVFDAAQYRRTAAKGFEVLDPPQPGTADFARLVEVLTVAPLRQGNRVTVLRNGCEIFPAMLEAIRTARETIDFATYVYWTGSIAPEFADALAERAAAGVAVNVLLDPVGAAKMDPDLVERLQRAGAQVAWFRPPRWYTLYKMNNRTHRKILVVDGRVGFTGGVGIAEEWTGNCEDPGHWRDTHVRVEGPVVRDLVGGFLDNWAEATGTILSGGAHLPDLRGFEDGVQAQVTRSVAEKGSTDAEQLFYSAIAGAKARIWLTTAYFAPRLAFVERSTTSSTSPSARLAWWPRWRSTSCSTSRTRASSTSAPGGRGRWRRGHGSSAERCCAGSSSLPPVGMSDPLS